MKYYSVKKVLFFFVGLLLIHPLSADEGMWMLNNLDSINNCKEMRKLGFSIPFEQLYDAENPSIKDAVVQFDGGCTGITVSGKGLIFTNHHCGFEGIQSQSSLEHDYLKDGFVSQTMEEEIPIPGMYVAYLVKTEDVTDRFLAEVQNITDEGQRHSKLDSLKIAIQDSINNGNPFTDARVESYFHSNTYYLQVYENYTDVRMVFAPPSSVGKFGGDTDNWMWPRHTGDFSVFRVYANKDNKPADFSKENIPYTPKYFVPISLKGYKENDFTMTIGYPGNTDRYLSSWGVQERVENNNKPRIEVRDAKLDIWRDAMASSDELRIMYASKYARSSNYWKYSIGMNRGIERMQVVEKKEALEQQYKEWLEKNPDKKAFFGEALDLIQQGYQVSGEQQKSLTYLAETLVTGTEIVNMATNIIHFSPESSPESQLDYLQNVIFAPYKDYSPEIDQKVLAAMLKIAKERIAPQYLPDIFVKIDKKYKGDYEKYAADLFKKSVIPYPEKLIEFLKDKKKSKKLEEDPAYELALSCRMSYFDIAADGSDAIYEIKKGERLFMAGLQNMMPDRKFYPDANFTMRMSYGNIGSYVPYDAAWYDYYSTTKGVFEKYKKGDSEFDVQPEILDLLRQKDFGKYGNGKEDMNLCFISNNDITGGNSGSPVFDGEGQLIGLAFDGNWEAMSGDIAYEPDIQKTISVDIRYVMFMIEKWGKCSRLLDEVKLVSETTSSDKLPE